MNNIQRWIIAVTGASGVQYAMRLIDVLEANACELHVIFSDSALRVLKEELDVKASWSNISANLLLGRASNSIYFYHPEDIGALPASGSNQFSGMVVVPCSMNSLAAIAHGLAQNLIQRAADVTIKENRSLILVPRETPLSSIHLENMLKLSKLGVRIVAAMPGFYHMPKSVADIIDMQVMKITDQMGMRIDLVKRWKDSEREHRILN